MPGRCLEEHLKVRQFKCLVQSWGQHLPGAQGHLALLVFPSSVLSTTPPVPHFPGTDPAPTEEFAV